MANKTLHNKKRLLIALEKHLGVVSSACNEVGLSRTTYYDYYNKDSKFKSAVDELQKSTNKLNSELEKEIKILQKEIELLKVQNYKMLH